MIMRVNLEHSREGTTVDSLSLSLSLSLSVCVSLCLSGRV